MFFLFEADCCDILAEKERADIFCIGNKIKVLFFVLIQNIGKDDQRREFEKALTFFFLVFFLNIKLMCVCEICSIRPNLLFLTETV